jgi:DNA-binding CsgD family transcriptional regulator
MEIDLIPHPMLNFGGVVVSLISNNCWKEPQPLQLGDFPGRDQLTRRELEVLTLIVSGLSTKEIAKNLSISPRTAEVHRARALKKLGARRTADLVRIVLRGS